MSGTLTGLFFAHRKQRDVEREKRAQYWREQVRQITLSWPPIDLMLVLERFPPKFDENARNGTSINSIIAQKWRQPRLYPGCIGRIFYAHPAQWSAESVRAAKLLVGRRKL